MRNLIKLKSLFILCLVICFLSGCNYTEKTEIEFHNMKKPITLQYKSKTTFWYSVALKDGNGAIHKFGNMSALANYLGEHYKINDTILNCR